MMRGKKKQDHEDQIVREWAAKVDGLHIEIEQWKRRAYSVKARYEAAMAEIEVLERRISQQYKDNQEMADRIFALMSRPPPEPVVLRPDPIDLAAVMQEFRKIVQPDIHVTNIPDHSDEQRRGIVWADQGLDNSGGTPERPRDPFDTPPDIPDYVLDVEKIDPNEVKGTRGGWYNPVPVQRTKP